TPHPHIVLANTIRRQPVDERFLYDERDISCAVSLAQLGIVNDAKRRITRPWSTLQYPIREVGNKEVVIQNTSPQRPTIQQRRGLSCTRSLTHTFWYPEQQRGQKRTVMSR